MRVLGFDPGTATTGFGVVDGVGNRLTHVEHGVISTPSDKMMPERLRMIFEKSQRLIQRFRPDYVAVEKLFFSRNVSTAITVAQARGVLVASVAICDRPVGEFSPLEVKNAVVGYGKAPKRQVQEMVKVLLNLEGLPKPDDAADALAIAICMIHSNPGRVPHS